MRNGGVLKTSLNPFFKIKSGKDIFMKSQAIIFDLDGTIVTTEDAWDKATAAILMRHGISSDFFMHQLYLGGELLGVTPEQWCRSIKDAFNLSISADDLFLQIKEMLFGPYIKEITFIHGFENFFTIVEQHNLKRAVATNSDDESLMQVSRLINLPRFFGKHIYNVSHELRPKPNPDLYLHAAKSLAVNPQLCIAIEDSAVGIAAAKAAGMFCIGINSSKNREQLVQADVIIESYDELSLSKIVDIEK